MVILSNSIATNRFSSSTRRQNCSSLTHRFDWLCGRYSARPQCSRSVGPTGLADKSVAWVWSTGWTDDWNV